MALRTTTFFLALCLGLFGYPLPALAQEQPGPMPLELIQGEWKRDPDNLKIALLLGGMLRREGHDEQARSVVEDSVSAVEKRIAMEGDSGEQQYLLGMGALFLKRNSAALEHFQMALSMQPEREEIHLGLIRALLSLDRVAEAKDALELAAALFPDSESVKSQLAEAYQRAGDYPKAIPILEELRVLKPEEPLVFDRLLLAYVKAGEAEKAAPLFQQLAEAGAISQIEATVHVFRIYLANGDLRAARIELQKGSRIDAHDPLLKDAFREYYARQALQAEAEGNHRRAVLFWERALEQAPEDWQAQYRLALAHATLQNYEEALERYVPLLEKQPADPGFYADVSRTLIALEKFEAAEKALQLGLKLASESNDNAALSKLREIRNDMIQSMGLPGDSAFQGK